MDLGDQLSHITTAGGLLAVVAKSSQITPSERETRSLSAMTTSVHCCRRPLGLLVLALCCFGLTTAGAAAVRADSVREQRGDSHVELSPSVQLVGRYDWEVMPSSTTGQPWSRCLDIVW
jgi:hypothetical protein